MCVHPGAELGFHTSNTMQLFDISVALWEMMLFSSFPSFFLRIWGREVVSFSRCSKFFSVEEFATLESA